MRLKRKQRREPHLGEWEFVTAFRKAMAEIEGGRTEVRPPSTERTCLTIAQYCTCDFAMVPHTCPWCRANGRYIPMPETDGGADFSLVTLDQYGKPSCVEHGAMNKVSPSPPGYWRCIALAGAKKNPCRAGCMERP